MKKLVLLLGLVVLLSSCSPADRRELDYVGLFSTQTGASVQVREGDVFYGFRITYLEHVQTYFEEPIEWFMVPGWFPETLIVTYEKELVLTGTLIRGDFGYDAVTYLVISEQDWWDKLPLDVYGIMARLDGFFFVLNDEAIIAEFGDEFVVESGVVISHVFLTYIRPGFPEGGVEIVSFEALNNAN